jgi:hypothetical protein
MQGKGLGAHELLMVRLMGCEQSASAIAKQSSTAQRGLGARPGTLPKPVRPPRMPVSPSRCNSLLYMNAHCITPPLPTRPLACLTATTLSSPAIAQQKIGALTGLVGAGCR